MTINGLILIIAAIVLIWFIGRHFFSSRHVNPLVALAKKIDFSLSEEHDYVLEHSLREFFLLGRGAVSPRLFYVLSSRQGGRHTKIFDYNGSALKHGMFRFVYQTMGFVEANGLNFSQFIIVPKTLYWRFKALFSKEIFVLKGLPSEFLKKYFLIVFKDKPAPSLSEDFFFHWGKLNGAYSLETIGNRFIFYRHNTIVPVRRMEEFYGKISLITAALTKGQEI